MPIDNTADDMVNDDEEEMLFELVEDLEATEYSIATDIAAGEAKLEFFNEIGTLSTFIATSDEIYAMAQRLLKAYDKLEGL